MIKLPIKILALILCGLISMTIPGYVYKYEAILSGKVLQLKEDYKFFVHAAEMNNESLEDFFLHLSQEGKRASLVSSYEEQKINKLIAYNKKLDILSQANPFTSLKAVISGGSDFKDIELEAIRLYKFDLALNNSNAWITACIAITILLYLLLNISIRILFRRKKNRDSISVNT